MDDSARNEVSQSRTKADKNPMNRTSRTRWTAIAAATLTTLSVALPANAAPEVTRTYLVMLPSQAGAHVAEVASAGGVVVSTLNNIDTLIVKMPESAAVRLATKPGWIVEPEMTITATATQDTPPSWGLDRVDQMNLPLNSSYTYPETQQGQGVDAYIIDTGVRRDHVEFTGRIKTGYQGYTDTSGTGDCGGHGTHVAGTIGGTTVGEAKQVSFIPVVVLSCSGSGSSTVMASAINWVVGNHVASQPAVANMSLGGPASDVIDALVTKLVNDGITTVVAAGNDNADACATSPARAPEAITVGATTSTDSRASYSNFGTCVDLFAPGDQIYSSYKSSSTSYATMSGTSMATPHTAGIVARYLSAKPTATPAEVWTALRSTLGTGLVKSPGTGSPNLLLFADPTGYPTGTTTTDPSATAPAQVTNVTATAASSTAISVSWSAPANGGSAITRYNVDYATNSAFTSSTTASSTATTLTLTGLTPATAYYIRVAAVNAVGTGAWSATASATTLASAPPAAPTNFTATAKSKSSITVSWTAPLDPITGYTLQMSGSSSFTAGVSQWTLATQYNSATVTGLRAGTAYYFRLNAVNSAGASNWTVTASATTPLK